MAHPAEGGLVISRRAFFAATVAAPLMAFVRPPPPLVSHAALMRVIAKISYTCSKIIG